MVELKEFEYIEDLQFNGLHIILSKALPGFTTDAVLLSHFAKIRGTDKVVDFGTGTGILPLLLYGRYGARVTGIELNERLCDMANRSFCYNGLTDKLMAVCEDFTESYKRYNGCFSALVCNPPYFDSSMGLASSNEERAVARTQISTTIDKLLYSANRVLKSGGNAFFCYPAEQITDLLSEMRKNSLEPKLIRFVRSKQEKAPYIVLVQGKKDGGKGVRYENDLIILNRDGSETEETKRIYHR